MYGHRGNRFYVNSASGLSKDAVDDLYEWAADENGSISLEELEKEVGRSINGTICGAVSVRDALQMMSGKSNVSALKMLRHGRKCGLIHRSPRGLVFTSLEDLQKVVDSWSKRVKR